MRVQTKTLYRKFINFPSAKCPDCKKNSLSESIATNGTKIHSCPCGYFMCWKRSENRNIVTEKT